ncbi:hypothetical protein HF086_002541 [Spodoptera exigua]|uniref:Amidophosphoribosyltransferase n=1 Tax=Spodoptera exigua TaxID=7107 RepID=A0A922M3T7_SPOEX|nr:hypothetical protein HF086_002541 [Spodoptera exigua]
MNGPEGPSRCCDDGCKDLNNTQAAMERLGMEETPGCEARTAGEVKVNSRRLGRGAVESGLTHECGVFGAISTGDWPTQVDIPQVICLGLVALQHRGQESAGIVTSEGKSARTFNTHKGMGLVNNIFNDEAMKKLKGNLGIGHTSYSLVIMLKDKIYAVRDPYGNRPLCLGKILPLGSSFLMNGCAKNGVEDRAEGWVVSSESCGFLSIGARYVREVLPGEIIEMSRHGIRTVDVVERPADKQQAFCIFEYVYFARADSIFEGQMVYSARMQCGRMLARESAIDADIVSSVPESGTAAAHGYARQSGIPFMEVLCKNRYVGRTFIQPSTRLRQLGVAKKFGALSENVRGKRIVLIDDSIVHIRIASPPLKYPCYMGINIPTREELIANKMDTIKLAEHVGADSLEYLSVEGLVSAVHYNMKTNPSDGLGGHCTACLTGEYPGGVPDDDW